MKISEINKLAKKHKHLIFNVLLVAILIFGFAVRLYKIRNPIADWHSFRQADTASVSRYYAENGINLLIPKYHDLSRVQSGIFNPEGYRFVEFPLYNAIHAILFKAIGVFTFEEWGRLLSIFSTLSSAVFLFLITNKLYGKLVGIISMLFFLFIPFNIYFTRVILPEPLAVMFALFSLWLFVLYQENNKILTLIISSLMLSIGVLVKPYVVFFGFPYIYYFYSKYIRNFVKPRKIEILALLRNKEIYLSIIIIFLPFLLWRMWMSKYPSGIPFWKWTFNGDGIRFHPAFWYWIFGERLGKMILGIWGVVPFVFGIISLKKKDGFIFSLLIGMFVYVSLLATANVRHDYYQTLVIPVVSIVLGKGFVEFWKVKYGNIFLKRIILIVCIGLGFIVSAFQVKEFYKVNHPEIIEAGKRVDSITPKNAIIIAAYNGDTAFLYQTKRRGWPVVELPIIELIEEGAEYYVSVNFDSQTLDFMNKFKIMEKTDKYVILDLVNIEK